MWANGGRKRFVVPPPNGMVCRLLAKVPGPTPKVHRDKGPRTTWVRAQGPRPKVHRGGDRP